MTLYLHHPMIWRHLVKKESDSHHEWHHVDPTKVSLKSSMEIWASDNKDYHLYLFLLAIVFRIALQKIPKLREYEHGVQVRINDDFFYRSILSRRLYDKGFRRLNDDMTNQMFSVMRQMHLHNVLSPEDTFHTTISILFWF